MNHLRATLFALRRAPTPDLRTIARIEAALRRDEFPGFSLREIAAGLSTPPLEPPT